MNINEQWRPVKGYEGLYEVSNFGRVKSLGNNKSRKEKILKPEKHRNGYFRVDLYKDGKVKHFYVHRLVAEAFIPNPYGFEQINHKNEDKTNNAVSNIEWCSAKYNINYGSHNKRSAASRINHPDRSKAVEASKYPDFSEICLKFASIMEAERNGFNHGNVSYCCRGCFNREGNNKYKNLYWRYAV